MQKRNSRLCWNYAQIDPQLICAYFPHHAAEPYTLGIHPYLKKRERWAPIVFQLSDKISNFGVIDFCIGVARQVYT